VLQGGQRSETASSVEVRLLGLTGHWVDSCNCRLFRYWQRILDVDSAVTCCLVGGCRGG
jgi:hypothetical protein